MIKFAVRNRFTCKVQFTAEIDCAADASEGVKTGLAVRLGVRSGANLTRANLADAYLTRADLAGANLAGANLTRANLAGANLADADLAGADLTRADLTRANLAGAKLADAYLTRADLAGANLADANLTRANLIDGGQRSDGYRFVGSLKSGVLMISAGCRWFSVAEAREHWRKTRDGTPLGSETFAILDHIEAVAKIRKLID